MISHLGQGLVLLALLLCAIGAPLGFVAGATRSTQGLAWTRRLALAFSGAMILANAVMEYALLTNDFSVSYVAHVGSIATPRVISFVSLWSSLEGSILFWGFMLGAYTIALAVLQRRGHNDYLAYSLATMMSVGLFFSFLIAGPANPFAPTPAPIPLDGPGPNALLQNHILMAVHPPMLYLGYVGMTVPFAMAVAALLRGRLGATWLVPLRNWLLVPTAFLSMGIMLGGWWSYEVLGWGGYWAWDPVENASFLPWLTAVAALHSALVLERRGTLKAWTVILVLLSFILTLLGTFLTRSGVVNSVHSFTQSPIGPAFLAFLGVVLIAVIVLLAMRIDTLVAEPGRVVLAREGAILVNNLLLVALTFTVFIGTTYPILAESLRGTKVSVGEPYFNRMAVPIFLCLLMLIGVGPALPWGRGEKGAALKALLRPLPAAAVGLLIAAVFAGWNPALLATGAFTGYALWVTMAQSGRPIGARRKRGESLSAATRGTLRRAPRLIGAYVAHTGFLVTFVAIAISSSYQTESEATLIPGQTLAIGDYAVRYDEVRVEQRPHHVSQVAAVTILRDGREIGELEPSLNHYPTEMQPLGTPAVKTRLGHDLYLTLMNVQRDDSIGLRAILTPAVLWIWIGVTIIVAGTMICLIPPAVPRQEVSAP